MSGWVGGYGDVDKWVRVGVWVKGGDGDERWVGGEWLIMMVVIKKLVGGW